MMVHGWYFQGNVSKNASKETGPILLPNIECGTTLIRYITGVLFFRFI